MDVPYVSGCVYPELEIAIFKKGYKLSAIARALHISTKAFTNKRKGKSNFTWDEVVTLHRDFFPEIPPERLMQKNQETC